MQEKSDLFKFREQFRNKNMEIAESKERFRRQKVNVMLKGWGSWYKRTPNGQGGITPAKTTANKQINKQKAYYCFAQHKE